jgi:Ca-activated chloride channel homolog
MHFAQQSYLHLLWAVPILGLFFGWSIRSRRRRLEKLVAAPLASRLARDSSRGRAVLRAVCVTGFVLFAILALARPQWGTRLQDVHRKGVDVMLALDTSYSMNTEDVAPSRLAVARGAVKALATRLRGDRVGLISFAGSAFVQCPLTLDYGAISLFLDSVTTGMIPDPGTSLAAAITAANRAFIAKETRYKVLVLFTDGEDLEGQVDDAVARAHEAGVVIYTVGIGSPDGRPIPIRDEKGDVVEYRKDPSGQVVISRLDERALARIATSTGGTYFRATAAHGEVEELADEISRQEKKELESRLYQNLEDRFQYPLGAAALLLFAACWISERRGSGSRWISGLVGSTSGRQET